MLFPWIRSIIDDQITELQDVKSALQSKVDQIKNLNDQIELLIDDASLEAEISSASDNFETTLNKAINLVNRQLQEIEKTEPISSSHRTTSNAFKLPKFELPDFNGNYLNWLSFWDLFNAFVHNSDTSTPAQKLQYLKSSLKGDAAKLINHLSIIDGNYELARDALVKRYAYNRVIVRGHIDAILKHPDLKIESAGNIQGLQEGVTENVRALRNMGLPLEHWDAILVHIVTSKLDHESRKAWELAHPGTDLPTFNAMMEILTQTFSYICLGAPCVHNLRYPCERKNSPLEVQEIQGAHLEILKQVQHSHFRKEIKTLQKGENLDPGSKISSLAPFLDDSQLLRVGGRLSQSDYDEDKKHPILLNKNGHLTWLLIRQLHEDSLHSGVQQTLYQLQQRY